MIALDPQHHKLILADIDNIAREAGIHRRFIEHSMTDECSADEIEWVKGWRGHGQNGCYGLCYTGSGDTIKRMSAMAGAFVRNFVNARVMTVTDVVDALKSGLTIDATVLLIPSFHRPGLPSFQTSLLWDLLEARALAEKLSVIQVQSIAQVGADYGSHFRDFIENHYQRVTA